MKKTSFKMLQVVKSGEEIYTKETGWGFTFQGLRLVAHKVGFNFITDAPIWRVSDPKTGTYLVADCTTRKQAIDEVKKEIIKRGGAKAVKKIIDKYR